MATAVPNPGMCGFGPRSDARYCVATQGVMNNTENESVVAEARAMPKASARPAVRRGIARRPGATSGQVVGTL